MIYLFDVHEISRNELVVILDDLSMKLNGAELVVVGNKIDKEDLEYTKKEFFGLGEILFISAKEKQQINELKQYLVTLFDSRTINVTETIVTNTRHVEELRQTNIALTKILEGMSQNLAGDFLAIDIRTALNHLGNITGEIHSDELLSNIFSKFCIGK